MNSITTQSLFKPRILTHPFSSLVIYLWWSLNCPHLLLSAHLFPGPFSRFPWPQSFIPGQSSLHSSAERIFLKNKSDHCHFLWKIPPELPPACRRHRVPTSGRTPWTSHACHARLLCALATGNLAAFLSVAPPAQLHAPTHLLPAGITCHWARPTSLTHHLGSVWKVILSVGPPAAPPTPGACHLASRYTLCLFCFYINKCPFL